MVAFHVVHIGCSRRRLGCAPNRTCFDESIRLQLEAFEETGDGVLSTIYVLEF